MEVWRDVVGMEDYYAVSTFGSIRSKDRMVRTSRGNGTRLHRGKYLSLKPGVDGYVSVQVSVKGRVKRVYVHRLVAEAFVPNHANKPEVNHKDGNKENNSADNLEWLTPTEHALYGYYAQGRTTPRKLNADQAEEVRELLAFGMKQSDVADCFGISQSNVSMINTRRTWHD